MKVFNGEGHILGRVAAAAAKAALLGEEVRVINCEKIVISGKKVNVFNWGKAKRARGGYPTKSQTHSRLPERFVRRSIRGMLPWKLARGKEAYRRILCYRGVPAEFASEKAIILSKETVKKLPTLKYVTIGDLCTHLGGKA